MRHPVRWEMAGFIFTVIAGVLLHFTYKWTGQNQVAGLFVPINESIWEHLKLLFLPALVFSLAEWALAGRSFKGIMTIKARAVLMGMAFIVAAYYTYRGIWGKDVGWVNIVLFILAALYVALYSVKVLTDQMDSGYRKNNIFGVICFAVLLVLFAWLTKSPLQIGLFKVP